MSTVKAIVMSLMSSDIIMTEVLYESDTSYVLKNPFELMTNTRSDGMQEVYFVRYLPYNEDGTLLVHKSAVVSLSLCSDRFNAMYERKVEAYIKANQTLSDPDTTAIMEGELDDEESDDSSDDEDEYDLSEAAPVRGPRTLH